MSAALVAARRPSLAFCAKCGKEQPTVKAYVQGKDGKLSRHKVQVCMICHERVFIDKPWSNAKPTKDATGKLRQSKAEANRGSWLLAAAKAGTITEFRMCNDHPRETYRLEVYGTLAVDRLLSAVECGDQGDVPRLCKELRRARILICRYTPDFSYRDDRGVRHVEDKKGRQSREYPLKKRLMLACHEIEIEEPR